MDVGESLGNVCAQSLSSERERNFGLLSSKGVSESRHQVCGDTPPGQVLTLPEA